jgi:hypothetical protein
MMTLCLSSIYEDLKMYQVEFKAMNAKLLMDPKRQFFLDQKMLAGADAGPEFQQGHIHLPRRNQIFIKLKSSSAYFSMLSEFVQ